MFQPRREFFFMRFSESGGKDLSYADIHLESRNEKG
jgi:hypothetical protein